MGHNCYSCLKFVATRYANHPLTLPPFTEVLLVRSGILNQFLQDHILKMALKIQNLFVYYSVSQTTCYIP